MAPPQDVEKALEELKLEPREEAELARKFAVYEPLVLESLLENIHFDLII